MAKTKETVTPRPTLTLPRSTFEIVLECAAIVGLFTFGYMLWSSYAALPETVPWHYGIAGKADSWGSKKILHFLFFFTCLLQFGLSVLAQYPHKFNYTIAITASNAATQYRLARTMLTALKALMVWMFMYIAWQTIVTARGTAQGLGAAFLVIVLGAVFGIIGIYLWLAHRAG